MGEPGAGKTTSMRNLNPDTTFYLDCDKKGLSWKGWREQYNTEKKNYLATDLKEYVATMLDRINTEEMFSHINVVIVDTLNGLMVADEMRRMKERGYDKWVDLAQCIWEILDQALTLRDDLTVIFICHSQTQKEDDGYTFTRIKTSGKKLDKLCIESKLTTVLYATVEDGQYVFRTHADHSTAKTPLDAFPEDAVPNDIAAVLEVLKEY